MQIAARREHMENLLRQSRLLEQAKAITPELISSFPGLAWVKKWAPARREYLMLLLSDEYISTLLGPKVLEYVGKSDREFWGDEIGLLFWRNDEAARLGDRRWVTEPFVSPLTGANGVFEGVKWAFTTNGETYVAGVGRNVEAV